MSNAPKRKPFDPNQLTDLSRILAPEPKRLPIGDKVYAFPAEISAESYRVMMSIVSATREAHAIGEVTDETADRLSTMTEEQARALRAEMVGDAAAEMEADGVHPRLVDFAERALFVWHAFGEEAFVQFWQGGGWGNSTSPGPNRAARRASAKKSGSKKKTRSSAS